MAVNAEHSRPDDDAPQASAAAEVAALRQRLRRAMRQRLDANLLPHEGQWLTPADLAASVRTEKQKARVRAFELLLLVLFGTGLSLVILAILRDLAY